MKGLQGIIIGAVVGFLSGIGYLNMNVKKSLWSVLFPVVTIITTGVGALAGGRISNNLQRSDKIDRALGIDKVYYTHYKVGRFWESKSTWHDCKGKLHTLKTFKAAQNTVSYLNELKISDHGTSASTINVTKYHQAAKNESFARLREKYGQEFLNYLEGKEGHG
ncbi:hypothetical protein SAMN06265348_110277 [Pedobacter westerhofensis]|uniref:Uncharacterized protein n=1 Tax=Pedobacter westerhofensis TaxID=425512 RepID=A0A521F818_9SPHI|nr:hypothetical protein [Pedobacter westerhofensis]SMO92313.1 hypothetical protein SAMN06265348_110277 [Pedobacter westerhofensis]